MDELDRLIQAYRARAASSVSSKLDVLVSAERVRDPRCLAFLLQVLANRAEPEDVRIHVLKHLSNGNARVAPEDRPLVARSIGDLLQDGSTPDLRLQAALALGGFTQIDGVLSSLSNLALAQDESIDLRYAAFTSLERAGPTAECVAPLRHMASDEMLGQSAHTVLSAWHIDAR